MALRLAPRDTDSGNVLRNWGSISSETAQMRKLTAYPGPNGVVVPGEGVKGPQLHPANAHLIFSILEEPTDVCPGLKQRGTR